MNDDDIMDRLSRALETQSVALTDDGGGSATDLLNKLSQQINSLHGQGVRDGAESEGTGYYTEESMVQLPDRATPYEVWKSKQGIQGKRRPQIGQTVTFGPPEHEEEGKVVQLLMAQECVRVKLANGIVTEPIHIAQINEIKVKKLQTHEQDELVSRLHGTKRNKDNTIKQQQNRELAEELRELKFKPTLNPKSMELAKQGGNKPMVERMNAAAVEKEKKLKDQREKQLEDEVSDVLQHPWDGDDPKMDAVRKAKKMSEKILRQGKKGERKGPGAVLQYGEETKLRRLQRKQIMEEMENRELTFTPQLNRASLQMQEKKRRAGHAAFDEKTGQTTPAKSVVKGGKGNNEDPGHEEEVFQPQMFGKRAAHPSKAKSAGPVHDRLFAQAQKSQVDRHNQQVDLLKKHTKDLPLKAKEMHQMDVNSPPKWAVKKSRASEGGKKELNVIEYSPEVDFILERLHTATQAGPMA